MWERYRLESRARIFGFEVFEGVQMRADEFYGLVRAEKVIAIVRGVDKTDIADVGEALYEGGIRLMEVTCNTPGFAEMIGILCERTAGRMVIGAGTVITRRLCEEALGAGAKYIIAPDVNEEVIEYCVSKDVGVIPGGATATEILTAGRCGAKMVKIFPACAIGAEQIRLLRGPIDNLDFVAVGGVRLNNVDEFMAAGCIGIGIGGEVVNREIVEGRRYRQISQRAREYVEKLKGQDG
jgi:2-dehydro-3-deoxyphosphogluconate aldolase/(4S)-4-hydroxy-2-oxoglutarate aldolase